MTVGGLESVGGVREDKAGCVLVVGGQGDGEHRWHSI